MLVEKGTSKPGKQIRMGQIRFVTLVNATFRLGRRKIFLDTTQHKFSQSNVLVSSLYKTLAHDDTITTITATTTAPDVHTMQHRYQRS